MSLCEQFSVLYCTDPFSPFVTFLLCSSTFIPSPPTFTPYLVVTFMTLPLYALGSLAVAPYIPSLLGYTYPHTHTHTYTHPLGSCTRGTFPALTSACTAPTLLPSPTYPSGCAGCTYALPHSISTTRHCTHAAGLLPICPHLHTCRTPPIYTPHTTFCSTTPLPFTAATWLFQVCFHTYLCAPAGTFSAGLHYRTPHTFRAAHGTRYGTAALPHLPTTPRPVPRVPT